MSWTKYCETTLAQFTDYNRYAFLNLAIIFLTGIGLTAFIMW